MNPNTKGSQDVKTEEVVATFASFEVSKYAYSPTKLRRSARKASVMPTIKPETLLPSELVDTLTTSDKPSKKRRYRESEEDFDSQSSLALASPKKVKRSYAAPESYEHLDGLPDHLAYELDVVFCGINPGYKSAETGHHYANPSNHFWRCLHRSGLTERLLRPDEDGTLPAAYLLGLTNLVERPSTEEAELSKSEMTDSVPALLTKIALHRPRMVCFIGIGIWRVVEQAMRKIAQAKEHNRQLERSSTIIVAKRGKKAQGKQSSALQPGIQPYKFTHNTDLKDGASPATVRETLFVVFPSTSGRVISHQLTDKIKLFARLKTDLDACKQSTIDTSEMTVITTHDITSISKETT